MYFYVVFPFSWFSWGMSFTFFICMFEASEMLSHRLSLCFGLFRFSLSIYLSWNIAFPFRISENLLPSLALGWGVGALLGAPEGSLSSPLLE